MSSHPHLRAIDRTATPEETAAIVAALERFRRVASAAVAPAPGSGDGWRRTALLEGVEREAGMDVHNPWINT